MGLWKLSDGEVGPTVGRPLFGAPRVNSSGRV